jgi:diaminopimelate epimerase
MSRAELMFYKMSGAGNDFIIFDGLDKNMMAQIHQLQESRSELSKKLCKRGQSVGADGLVIIEPARSGAHFSWDFYNSDGSKAEMCGNAARCAASLMFQKGYVPTKMQIETDAGIIDAEYMPDRSIKVLMASDSFEIEKKTVTLGAVTLEGSFINTGVPHFVLNRKIDTTTEMKAISTTIRAHRVFGASGTNVTQFEELEPRKIKSISYERGVEDFTLACGTGTVAAALVYAKSTGQKLDKEIEVVVPGGSLFVSLDEKTQRPALRGPAKIIYIGHLNLGAMA